MRLFSRRSTYPCSLLFQLPSALFPPQFSSFVLGLLLVLTTSLPSAAQSPKNSPKTPPAVLPLTFVNGQAILIIDPTDENIVGRALQRNPFAAPETPTLSELSTAAQRALARRWQAALSAERQAATARAEAPFNDVELAQLFLLTGSSRLARALDSLKCTAQRELPIDSLASLSSQRLLNSLSHIAATSGRQLWLNRYENSLIRVQTDQFSCDLDVMVSPRHYKVRINPTDRAPLTLRLLLPVDTDPSALYHNGHRILRPQIEGGYLLLTRSWRTGEEILLDRSAKAEEEEAEAETETPPSPELEPQDQATLPTTDTTQE